MNLVLLFLIVLVSLILLIAVFDRLRSWMLPAYRRMNRNERIEEHGEQYQIGQRIDQWVRSIVPPHLYHKAEMYLSRNGQSSEWTVTKLIRSIVVASISGLLVCGLLILIYFSVPGVNPILILLALMMPPLYTMFPFLLFKSERKDFLARIMYQTAEFLDILEDELVRGSGSIEIALNTASAEMEGELRAILRKATKFLLKNPGNLEGTCKIIEEHIADPLYDQITLMMRQYHITGKAKSSLESLKKTCRKELERVHRQQTRDKSLMITVVSLGVIANLALLIGVPMLSRLTTQFLPFS